MKTSTMQDRKLGPTIGRIVVAIAVAASVMGGLTMITPALSANDHDRGWHKGQDRRDYNRDRNYYRPEYRRPEYVPPPAYYYPQQSPGISLFFPLDFRR